MSVEEINKAVKSALQYDDYLYQKENNILITEEFRAEGLHKVLYQCPHCLAESKMDSKGSEIFCTACGKRWNLKEDGNLVALEGETNFPIFPIGLNGSALRLKSRLKTVNISLAMR